MIFGGWGASCGIPKRIEMITTLVTIFIDWERLTIKNRQQCKIFRGDELENLGSLY